MDEKKLARAAQLEAEASRLRQEAFDERPLPKKWRVGQKVRYLRDEEWAWCKGAIAAIIEVRDQTVFYTSFDGGKTHRLYTTPSDVELIEDVDN